MRIYTHPEYLNHLVMDGHPERPERLSYLMKHLQKLGLTDDFEVIKPRAIPEERILVAHSQAHLDFLLASQPEDGLLPLDPDTWMSTRSMSAARLAAGAVFEGMDCVLNGSDQRVLCRASAGTPCRSQWRHGVLLAQQCGHRCHRRAGSYRR